MGVYDIGGNSLVDGSGQVFPDYLLSETNRVIQTLPTVCEDKTYLFLVIADSHNERDTVAKTAWSDAMAAIGRINDSYKADAIIHLGDIIHGVEDAAAEKAIIRKSVADMLRISPRVYLCRGNHESDFAYEENHWELISTNEIYALTDRQNEEHVVRPENKLYYYVDYGEDIRCVFLDSNMIGYSSGQTTNDLRETTDGVRYGYDAEQIAWFRDVALNTTRQVAVFSHMPASRTNMTQPSMWTDENRNSFDNIKTVASNFVSGGGTIVGWFFGHIHSKVKSTSTGFTEFGLRNSFYTATTSGGVHSIPNFSLIAIKPDVRRVDVVSFGQDADDSFTY